MTNRNFTQYKLIVLCLVILLTLISTNVFAKNITYLQATNTPTPTSFPLFVCNNDIPGLTCQNFGSYMRYDVDLYQENNLINTDWIQIQITSAMASQDVYIFYDLTYTFSNPSVPYSGWDRQLILATLYGTQPHPFNYWAPSVSGVYENSGMAVQNFYGAPGIFLLAATGQWSEDTAIQGSIIFSSISTLPTATPTATVTPSNTPTVTFTPSNTPTATRTYTPTPLTPTPRSHGNGTCWDSDESWPGYSVPYRIDSSIPTSWINSINIAANAWTNVSPSSFSFINLSDTSYSISLGYVDDDFVPAYTWYAYIGSTLTDVYTIFNDDSTFDTNNPSAPSNYNVQNIMTHEFGHWLVLVDLNATCATAMMYGGFSTGEYNKVLSSADENAINWQYP